MPTRTSTTTTGAPTTTTTTITTIPPTIPNLPRSHLSQILSRVLTKLCSTNTPHFPPPHPSHRTSLFYSIHPPNITLHTYLRRLLRYAPCSDSAFIIALVYLDRLQKQSQDSLPKKKDNHKLMITALNVHRLLVSCIVIAGKWIDDLYDYKRKGISYFDQVNDLKFWARVGGIATIDEMKRLEMGVCKELNWNLFVDLKTYKIYEKSLLIQAKSLKMELLQRNQMIFGNVVVGGTKNHYKDNERNGRYRNCRKGNVVQMKRKSEKFNCKKNRNVGMIARSQSLDETKMNIGFLNYRQRCDIYNSYYTLKNSSRSAIQQPAA